LFTPAAAQEALRESLAGERAAAARKEALERQAYNIQTGQLRLLAGAGLKLEYSDNITYVDAKPQSDFILTPQVNTRAYWPISEANALTVSLGLGYVKYFQHDENDYFLLEPGSAVALDLFVKDFRFTVYDRASYTLDPLDSGAIRGVARYGGLQNTAGLDAFWDQNELILAAGYGHFNFISGTADYEYLDRGTELFLLKASFMPDKMVTVGPEATASINNYRDPLLSDSVSYSAGAFADLKLSQYLRVTARAGYVAYDFTPSGDLSLTEDLQTYYFSLGVNHVMNERITHALSGGREVRLGYYADYEELFYVRYNINWNVIRNVGFNTSLFYEHGTQPPYVREDENYIYIFLGETYDRFGGTVSLSHQFLEKLAGRLSYRYTLRTSDTDYRDYAQNAVTVDVTYRF
jgi:hypothetical protein